jgi:hypothetical protein
MPVGSCNAEESLRACTGGGNGFGNLGFQDGACSAGNAIGISIVCNSDPSVIDLKTVVSPLKATTKDNNNHHMITCSGQDYSSGGREQGFEVELCPRERLEIGQTDNNYDSMHELRYGGAYPGERAPEEACYDDPDIQVVGFTNEGSLPVMAYFLVDSYSTAEGDFTVAWTIIDTTVIDLKPFNGTFDGTTLNGTDCQRLSCAAVDVHGIEQGFSYEV